MVFRRALFLLVLILPCVVSSGCGKLNFFSTYRDREIIIDGKYTDFGNAMVYYDEKDKVAVNLLNDNDYLYICLISRNRKIETKLMESGFLVWFDPNGGKKKNFGIRFPIGLREMGIPLEKAKKGLDANWRDQEDISDKIDKENEVDISLDKQLVTLEGLQDKLMIMGPPPVRGKSPPGNKDMELNLQNTFNMGIEAKVGRQNGYFVYELKVPLVKSVQHPYAIEAKTGMPIGLGLEMQSAGKMSPPGMEMGERRQPEKSLQLWGTVILSHESA